jgi:5-methyltetrahydrofolate--homocysteine methyltransferase
VGSSVARRRAVAYPPTVVRSTLETMLTSGRVLLADGATGTNYFRLGLGAGEAPELWNAEHPERVQELHQAFVDAGSDIILTNTFGANRHRLQLHGAQDRAHELNQRAAELAREVADGTPRPIVVAGSVGPTGELFEPLGALSEAEAIDTFAEQIAGLRAGGADVAWIETMSAPDEMRAAARAAIAVEMPYTVTGSFDTAGRTMMGLHPAEFAATFRDLSVQPVAVGANCGVGASDILVTLLAMVDATAHVISKGNCGIPHVQGAEVVYSGTPDLMAEYARLAVDAGAAIVGGCCGTTPEHVRAMRAALDAHTRATPPTLDDIVNRIGPLANATPDVPTARTRGRNRVH